MLDSRGAAPPREETGHGCFPSGHSATPKRTFTRSPTTMPSAARTTLLSGTTYRPSFGYIEVVHRVDPITTSTGIIPQPYVTTDDRDSIRALSSSGTVTKKYGDGPRHSHTSPLNSKSTRSPYRRRHRSPDNATIESFQFRLRAPVRSSERPSASRDHCDVGRPLVRN